MTKKSRHQVIREMVRRLIQEEEKNDDEQVDSGKKKASFPHPTAMDTGLSVDNQLDEQLDKYEHARDDEDIGFDPEGYANDVFNLIENIETLIEMRDIIVKRAAKRLIEHKGKADAQAFVDAMKNHHGVVVGKADGELDNEIVPPTGVGGGPDTGGGISGAPA